MHISDDALLVWRIVNAVATATCLILLSRRYYLYARTYNQKTLDYWYALTTWCFAGLTYTVYSMVTSARAVPVLPVITVAAIVSLKGLLSRTEWGGSA